MGYSWPLLAYVWLESHVKRTRDHQGPVLPHALTSVLPLVLLYAVFQQLQHHLHHHHHAQLSVSPNVSQPAQLPVAHRRNIKKWNGGIYSFVGWILAFISIESFSGHHRTCS